MLRNNKEARQLFIVVAAIILSLSAIALVKFIYDEIQTALYERAAASALAEQEKQNRINNIIKNLPRKFSDLDSYEDEFDDETMDKIRIAWLKDRYDEYVFYKNKYISEGEEVKQMENSYESNGETKCDFFSFDCEASKNHMKDYQEKALSQMNDYNSAAETMPEVTLQNHSLLVQITKDDLPTFTKGTAQQLTDEKKNAQASCDYNVKEYWYQIGSPMLLTANDMEAQINTCRTKYPNCDPQRIGEVLYTYSMWKFENEYCPQLSYNDAGAAGCWNPMGPLPQYYSRQSY